MYDADSWPTYYSRCSGSEVWDLNGRRYVDFLGGVGSVLLGYSDPDVNAAVKRRITLGSYCSLVNPEEPKLAEKLLDLHPWAKGGKVRFVRTGGEAMSVAIRCARSYKNKSGIAFCGYHGWHDWYLSANLGEDDALDGHLLPGLEPTGVPRELKGTSVPFRYNDIESFDAAIEQLSDNLAAVVMEPMRSQFPAPEFIKHIVETCRLKDIVLIVDEITSGMRHGYPGAHLNIGLQPDIVVYAKAMSNGIPFGAIVGKKNIMEKSEESFISSSYWTDGLGTAAALAVLDKAEKLAVQKQVWEKGVYFQNELKVIAGKYPSCKMEIAGMPSSPSITFHLEDLALKIKTIYIQKMVERGFLVSTYFYLMLTHTPDHLSAVLKAINEVLREISSLIESDGIDDALPANSKNKSGFARLA
jgi:glutamate-1-semialdehyde 2,1-aminomutase